MRPATWKDELLELILQEWGLRLTGADLESCLAASEKGAHVANLSGKTLTFTRGDSGVTVLNGSSSITVAW